MKESGAQRRPIMKEREKLRVARVERKRPRRRRERDLMRWVCWVVVEFRESKAARRSGRRAFVTIEMRVASV
jgi:hypothetical protein